GSRPDPWLVGRLLQTGAGSTRVDRRAPGLGRRHGWTARALPRRGQPASGRRRAAHGGTGVGATGPTRGTSARLRCRWRTATRVVVQSVRARRSAVSWPRSPAPGGAVTGPA